MRTDQDHKANIQTCTQLIDVDFSGFAVFIYVHFLVLTETNMPYHPCLFFVKVEVGRKKNAEEVSDAKFFKFEADGVDAC